MSATFASLRHEPFPSLAPEARAATLSRLQDGLSAEAVLAEAITADFAGRIALVSSFGAESAVLLDMVARIDPSTPVLFLETGLLFRETLAYQRDLAGRLGLRDVRLIRPDPADLAAADPGGRLHRADADACCALRKVAPLERALDGFDAWITGRKRHQSATRAALDLFEADAAGRMKLNPLADWTAEGLRAYARRRNLPPHPLVPAGFTSIGCAPCTTPVGPGEDPRAGRWRDRGKIECGIHFENGRAVRVRTERRAPLD